MSLTSQSAERPATVPLGKRLWYKYAPTQFVGEVLSRPWIDTAVPVVFLLIVLAFYWVAIPSFFSPSGLSSLGRLSGEYLLIGIGQAIVILAGGIDLSIGSIFAICNIVAMALTFDLQVHVALVLPLTILAGAAIGSVNGYLIGYMRLRAFLTTLVTLIILRALVNIISVDYGQTLGSDYNVNGEDLLEFVGDGKVLGIPTSLAAAMLVAIVAHFFLTRTRLGWHMVAVGGSRRAAFNTGVNVRRTVFLTYVICGALTGAAAYFYAARLSAVSFTTGLGMEFIIITGAVLGGISLGGGRGSITKAIIGTFTLVAINNGMLRVSLPLGVSSMVLGCVLLFAVTFDIRWTKIRFKLLNRAYMSPKLVELPPSPGIGPDSAFARNEALGSARAIGVGIDGPEDIVIDDEGNMFCGCRSGAIYRLAGPDFTKHELFAQIGGRPLGVAVDRDGSIVVCVAGMGVHRVTKDRKVIPLSVQTNRSWSLVDDSRVKMSDDLDIAPDGKIYYSDSTTRFEASAWVADATEAGSSGRLLCYDPSDGTTRTVATGIAFANGVCLSHDRQSVLLAETFSASIWRYWIAGPKKGQREAFITNMPGYPDNVNRASDGSYWVALVGTRSPVFDLALTMPDFRGRMVRQVSSDNWLIPNMNSGCIAKVSESGQVLGVWWDPPDGQFPQITSVREHKGKIYLGGVSNDRIGVFDLPDADPEWTSYASYWGAKA